MPGEHENPLWTRTAHLRPILDSHAHLSRRCIQDEPEYILHNRLSGRHYRFSENAYYFIARMDGVHTIQDLFDGSQSAGNHEALSRQQLLELLFKLSAAGVLRRESLGDAAALFDSPQHRPNAGWVQRLKNPLSVRIPLFDPDQLLQRMLPLGRLLFSRWGALLWSSVIGLALILTASNWDDIRLGASAPLLSPQNLLLIALCYPVMKALHELGHGLATKVWGGAVHETGIILVALMPIPYVDASEASGFPEKHRRLLVSAAGIMVELFVAAVALLVWLNTEPGLVQAIAYNAMLIGGVSTLLFNSNPLLRFDGYYLLSDFIGIPNLATRSRRFLGYLVQRYLFGVVELGAGTVSSREKAWLVGYGVLAFGYRVTILIFIILFVAETYPVIGLVIAIWSSLTLLILPLIGGIRFLLAAPQLEAHRTRALLSSGGFTLLLAAVLFFIPVPLATVTQGVVVPPDRSELRAGTDGVVTQLLASADSQVQEGQPLVEMEDEFLHARIQVAEAKLLELLARRSVLQTQREQVEASLLDDKVKLCRADLDRLREKQSALIIRSPANGILVLQHADDLPGRFLRKGERLGYVADSNEPTVRALISQADIGLVTNRTNAVSVRLAERPAERLQATLERQIPAASVRLPSRALGPAGGGPFAVDPSDEAGLQLAQSAFQMELRLDVELRRIGERAFVRFDHGMEPIAWQWYRRLRQLFLRRFNT
jgi:putative peptide zinc metalloprotease protein